MPVRSRRRLQPKAKMILMALMYLSTERPPKLVGLTDDEARALYEISYPHIDKYGTIALPTFRKILKEIDFRVLPEQKIEFARIHSWTEMQHGFPSIRRTIPIKDLYEYVFSGPRLPKTPGGWRMLRSLMVSEGVPWVDKGRHAGVYQGKFRAYFGNVEIEKTMRIVNYHLRALEKKGYLETIPTSMFKKGKYVTLRYPRLRLTKKSIRWDRGRRAEREERLRLLAEEYERAAERQTVWIYYDFNRENDISIELV